MTTNEIKKVVSEANETSNWKCAGDDLSPFGIVGSAHDNVITYKGAFTDTGAYTDSYWEAMLSNIECNLCESPLHPETKAFFAARGVRG